MAIAPLAFSQLATSGAGGDSRSELERLRKLKRLKDLEAKAAASAAPPIEGTYTVKPSQPAPGFSGAGVNPMVQMGEDAQREAVVGESSRYTQGKVDQVNAARPAPVDPLAPRGSAPVTPEAIPNAKLPEGYSFVQGSGNSDAHKVYLRDPQGGLWDRQHWPQVVLNAQNQDDEKALRVARARQDNTDFRASRPDWMNATSDAIRGGTAQAESAIGDFFTKGNKLAEARYSAHAGKPVITPGQFLTENSQFLGNIGEDLTAPLDSLIPGASKAGEFIGGGLQEWGGTALSDPMQAAREANAMLNPTIPLAEGYNQIQEGNVLPGLGNVGVGILGMVPGGSFTVDAMRSGARAEKAALEAQRARVLAADGAPVPTTAVPPTAPRAPVSPPRAQEPVPGSQAAQAAQPPPVTPAGPSAIPQPPGRGAQAGATGAGQQPPVPPQGPPSVLNASPQPAAPGIPAIARSDAKIIGRLLRAGGVPRNDVDSLLTGLLNAHQGSNQSRLPLAFFAEDYLPTVLPKQVADDVIQKLRGFGRERSGANSPKDPSRSIVRGTINELRGTQRSHLTDQFEGLLGKETLMTKQGKIARDKQGVAEAVYAEELGRQQRLIDDGKATPEQLAARDELLLFIGRKDIFDEVPRELKLKAADEGKNLWEYIHTNPLDAAHWMQSELGVLARKGDTIAQAMRMPIVRRLEEAVPGYRGARMEYGDLSGQQAALEFGDDLYRVAANKFQLDEKALEFRKLSKAQKTVARKSIRDKLLNEFRKAKSGDDQAAVITQMQKDGVLDALETILGPDGKKVADAIRNIVKENERLRSVDLLSGSNTADNLAQMRAAQEAVRSPINKAVGSIGDNGSYARTIFADAVSVALGLPPVWTAGKLGTAGVGRLGSPSRGKLASATRTLYEIPKPRNALAEIPSRSPAPSRGGPPRGPRAPARQITQDDLDALLKQYDANPSPTLRNKIIAARKKLDAQTPAVSPPRNPPEAMGFFGKKPPKEALSAPDIEVGPNSKTFRAGDGTTFEVSFDPVSKGGVEVAFRPVDGPRSPKSAMVNEYNPLNNSTLAQTNEVFRQVEKLIADDIKTNARERYLLPGRTSRQRELYANIARHREPPAGYEWEMAPSGKDLALVRKPPAKAGIGSSSLPMDEGSRMARAREQGFDVEFPVYHGSRSGGGFDEFQTSERGRFGPGVYFSEQPGVAGKYGEAKPYVVPTTDQLFDAMPRWNSLTDDAEQRIINQLRPHEKEKLLAQKNWYKREGEAFWEALRRSVDGNDGVLADARASEVIQAAGFKGIRGIGDGQETVIFDPKHVRRTDAKFDPAESGSSKLLAGMGASPEGVGAVVGAGVGYATAQDENGDGVVDARERSMAAGATALFSAAGVAGTRKLGALGRAGANTLARKARPQGPPRVRGGVNALGIKAYHGSPHDFDKFDSSKLGTGEGVQAYGRGLYFAENEAVAKGYRDTLAAMKMEIGGKPFAPRNHSITKMVGDHSKDHAALEDALNGYIARNKSNPFADVEDAQAIVDAIRKGEFSAGKGGRLYEVDIEVDPEHFLDWDRPVARKLDVTKPGDGKAAWYAGDELELMVDNDAKLYAQRDVLMPLIEKYRRDPHNPAIRGPIERAFKRASPEYGLKEIERKLWPTLGDDFKRLEIEKGPEAAQQWARDQGYKGIKFLDGGSRNAGDGTRNYVVFDDKHVNIINKSSMFGGGSRKPPVSNGFGSSNRPPKPKGNPGKPRPVEARRAAPRGNTPFSDPRLSPGENKTAEMILNGHTYKEIADEMMTSLDVVKKQASNAQKKLGADVQLPRPGMGKRPPGSTKRDAAFELFNSGVENAQVAERLGMSIGNVRTYRSYWKEEGRAPVASVEGAAYNPPAMPERPFEADYPQKDWPDGPPVDAQGRLTRDMDRRPLDQNSVIIGRNKAPGYGPKSEADRNLRDRIAVIQTLKKAGSSFKRVPRSPDQTSGAWAPKFNDKDRYTGRGVVQITDDLDRPIAGLDDQEVITLAHELSHSIDFKVSPARNTSDFNNRKWGIDHKNQYMPPEIKAELQSQLQRIYRDLNNPIDGEVKIRTPKDRGYDPIDEDRELWAEAIRAYMYDPNYIKTVAPDVAFMIRDHVNRNSSLRKTIQFNAIPTIVGVGGLGLGAVALNGQPAEAQKRPKQ